MKNRRRWVSLMAGFLALVMLLSLIVSIIPAHASEIDDINENISSLENKIENMQSRSEKLEEKIQDLTDQQNQNYEEIINVVNQKVNIEQQINLILEQIDVINEQISAYSQLIANMQEELDIETDKFYQLNDKYRDRIRTMEEEGTLSYWSVLFKASSFSDFLDRLNMIQEIAEADARRIRELNDAAMVISAAKERMDSQKADAEEKKKKLDESEALLQEKQLEAQELIDILLERHEEYEALLEEASAEKEALAREIEQAKESLAAEEGRKAWLIYQEQLRVQEEKRRQQEEEERKRREEEEQRRQEAIANGEEPPEESYEEETPEPETPEVSDGWILPMAYYTMVTSTFGPRVHPITGEEYSFHSGIDLAADYGTSIYAARSGTVTTSAYHWSFGNYVVISHGDGYATLYAHMQSRAVSEGDVVRQGQTIGYVGSTGESTGPHLHYTVYYNGELVNPAYYL